MIGLVALYPGNLPYIYFVTLHRFLSNLFLVYVAIQTSTIILSLSANQHDYNVA